MRVVTGDGEYLGYLTTSKASWYRSRKFVVTITSSICLIAMAGFGAPTEAYVSLASVCSVYLGGQSLVDHKRYGI
jgi:hypothetical protein